MRSVAGWMGWVAVGLAASGCGGGAITKEEWDGFKQSYESFKQSSENKNKEQDETLAKEIKGCKESVSSDIDKINKRFTEATQEYSLVQAKFEAMKNVLNNFESLVKKWEEDLKAIDGKVTTSNANLITALEAESKLLEDRLVELKRTIEDLKKPK